MPSVESSKCENPVIGKGGEHGKPEVPCPSEGIALNMLETQELILKLVWELSPVPQLPVSFVA